MRNKTDLIKYCNLLNSYLDENKYSIDDVLPILQEYLVTIDINKGEVEQKIDFIKELFSKELVYLKVFERGRYIDDLFNHTILIIFNLVGDIWCLVNIDDTWNELDLLNLELKEFNIEKIKRVYKKLLFTIPVDNYSYILSNLEDLIIEFLNDNKINLIDEIIFILKILGKEAFSNILKLYEEYKNCTNFEKLQEYLELLKKELEDIKLDKFKIYNQDTNEYENYSMKNDTLKRKEEHTHNLSNDSEKPMMIIEENKPDINERENKENIILKEKPIVKPLNMIREQIFTIKLPKVKNKIIALKKEIIIDN